MVLPNNYSPDYAPFTVDKEGTLEKVPVQIRVSLKALKELRIDFWNIIFQIDLIKILEINEVGQIFGNQFSLYMTW